MDIIGIMEKNMETNIMGCIGVIGIRILKRLRRKADAFRVDSLNL